MTQNPYSSCVPQACAILEQHGNRLSLRRLSEALGLPAEQVRVEVSRYGDVDDSAEINPAFEYFLHIEPYQEDCDEESDEDIVVLAGSPEEFLGLEQFDARVYGALYRMAEKMVGEEPDNEVLARASNRLREVFLPGVAPIRTNADHRVASLSEAIRLRKRVRIHYARAWEPGADWRTIEPWLLHFTSRGYEVDGAALDRDGAMRSFLVSGIRELEVLDEGFEPPQDARQVSESERSTELVTGIVPQKGKWAIHKYGESVRWIDDRPGDDFVAFKATLLPPLAERSALVCLSAGEGSYMDDERLDRAVAELAEQLWHHHDLDSR